MSFSESFIQLQQLCIFKCHCVCILEECLSLVSRRALSLLALNRNALISSRSLKMWFSFNYRKKISEVKKKSPSHTWTVFEGSVGGAHKYQKSTGTPAYCPHFSLIGYNVSVKKGPWTKRSLLNLIFYFCEYGLCWYRNNVVLNLKVILKTALSVIVFVYILYIFIFILTANCIIVSYHCNRIISPNYLLPTSPVLEVRWLHTLFILWWPCDPAFLVLTLSYHQVAIIRKQTRKHPNSTG